jgi:protoporphyrinogen oxidase
MKVGILGGGLTALTIANTLKQPHEIIEKNKECGGLCRSISEKGFTFDLFGGHILFSKDKETLDWMLEILGENTQKKRRNNKVLVKGRLLKYPFENDLSHLGLKDNLYCMFNYLFNQYAAKEPANFREWIYHTFGKGIAELYMVPYNEKIWKHELNNMSLHWVYGRVPKPPKMDVIKSSLGISTEGYTHQLYFYYPTTGGIQALIKALEVKAGPIELGYEIKKISKEGTVWKISDGKTVKEYDQIISTIPLTDLIKILPDVPKEVRQASSALVYNSLICVLIGLKRPQLNDYTAIYMPGKEISANRVCFMNNFSEYSSKEGNFALIVEHTVKREDLGKEKDADIASEIIRGLSKQGIINKRDVIYTKVVREKYAYVVYDLEYQKNIKTVREYVNSLGIKLCGRFAEFEYLNMDACVKRALDMAKSMN